MSREILFKAKRVDNGEWVQGSLVWSGDTYKEFRAIIIPKEKSNVFLTDEEDLGFENWYMIDPETICQYTGLTDKNGKKIWENDIVKYHFGEKYAPVKFGVYQSCFDSTKTGHCGFYVDWSEREYIRKDLGYWIDMVDAEVAGNVFDNPELLEGEAD